MDDHEGVHARQTRSNSMVAPAREDSGTEASRDALIAEYEQVGSQFRALTDIRFKLLGFLPVGTIATVLVAKDNSPTSPPVVAAFGLVVTLCLAVYNKRNDQLYDELVSRAAELEGELGLKHGSFSQRPTTWLSFGPCAVEHGWPIGLVYAASVAVWTYLLVGAVLSRLEHSWMETRLGPALAWSGAVCVVLAWIGVRAWERAQRTKVRAEVEMLLQPLGDERMSMESLVGHFDQTGVIRRLFRKGILENQMFALEQARQMPGEGIRTRALALVLARVTRLPARWIEDVWSRQG